jgi:hypothetical protein
MQYRITKMCAVFFFLIWLAPLGFGQQPQGQTQTRSSDPQYVDTTGFKGKIFELKHRDPSELRSILQALGSGFKGATMTAHSEYKTLTVRDFPENIAAIEEALKRLDVPASSRSLPQPDPNVQLHLHVLIASNVEGASNQHPAELKDVLKQLQATLNYKNYYLLTSIVQRGKLAINSDIQGVGTATAGAPLFDQKNDVNAQYEYRIRYISREESAAGDPAMYVRDFYFTLQGIGQTGHLMGNARVSTNLSLRDGEKVVVGTASLKDKAMVLVLTAKIVP